MTNNNSNTQSSRPAAPAVSATNNVQSNKGENLMTNTNNTMAANLNELQAALAAVTAKANVFRPAEPKRTAESAVAEYNNNPSWVLPMDVAQIGGASLQYYARAIEEGKIVMLEPKTVHKFRAAGGVVLSTSGNDKRAQWDQLGKAIALFYAMGGIYTRQDMGDFVQLTNRFNGNKMALVYKEREYKGRVQGWVGTYPIYKVQTVKLGKVQSEHEEPGRNLIRGHQAYIEDAFAYLNNKKEESRGRNPFAPYAYEILETLLRGGQVGIHLPKFKTQKGWDIFNAQMGEFVRWGIARELCNRAHMLKDHDGKIYLPKEVVAQLGGSPWDDMFERKMARLSENKLAQPVDNYQE